MSELFEQRCHSYTNKLRENVYVNISINIHPVVINNIGNGIKMREDTHHPISIGYQPQAMTKPLVSANKKAKLAAPSPATYIIISQ